MRALIALLVLTAGPPLLAPGARAQVPAGSVRSDQGTMEIVPASPGEVRTPEGFMRVEGGAPATGVGTFGTYRAGGPPAPPGPRGVAATRELPTQGGLGAGPTAGLPPAPDGGAAAADPCRDLRNRYLEVLLRMAGIDLEQPLDLADGLAGPGGSQGSLLFTPYGVLASLDPIRPLAWNPDLRRAARELAACQAR